MKISNQYHTRNRATKFHGGLNKCKIIASAEIRTTDLRTQGFQTTIRKVGLLYRKNNYMKYNPCTSLAKR